MTGPPGPCGCGCALTEDTSFGFDIVEFAEALGRPYDPWQRWVVIHACELRPDGLPRFRKVLVLVGRQNGKALDVDTPILTADGWSTMGALDVGDRVFHPDGSDVLVTEAHPVMHDRECFRVTTTDGRSVVADAEHLWTVQDTRRVTKTGRRGERPIVTRHWETLTTMQILERGLFRSGSAECSRRDYAFRLPRQQMLKSPDIELPIDPYLLGAWLGDGSSRSAALTVGDEDLEQVVPLVRDAGAIVVSLVRDRTAWRLGFRIDARHMDGFQARCSRLGIWGNKHVPDLYLRAGTSQRMALLQGLLDTDGSIEAKRGQVEFCSTRRQLADAVLYLARSLGWRATLRENDSTLCGEIVGRRWRVTFTPDAAEGVPFRLPRKAERVRSGLSASRHAVSIASIEPVESRLVRCIRVDRPDGQFLAGRGLMATHNTELLVPVSIWWLYVLQVETILGTSTKLEYASDSMKKAWKVVRVTPWLMELQPARKPNGYYQANGFQRIETAAGNEYRVAPADDEGGRSKTIALAILDELRQHHDYSAYDAVIPAQSAVRFAQCWMLSNEGGDESIVMHDLVEAAERHIRTRGAEGDDRLFLASYTTVPGTDPEDVDGLLQANPSVGYRKDLGELLSEARSAKAVGGLKLTGFLIESMCQRVAALADVAVDKVAWRACRVGDDDLHARLSAVKDRLCVALDVSPDTRHVSLVAAALEDDEDQDDDVEDIDETEDEDGDGPLPRRVLVRVVRAWEGDDATDRCRAELADLVEMLEPLAAGYFPNGPAGALAVELDEAGFDALAPAQTRTACQSLATLVKDIRVAHGGDPMLTDHVEGSRKLGQGDGWRFGRRGTGYVDGAYALAGAVHLARTNRPVRLRVL